MILHLLKHNYDVFINSCSTNARVRKIARGMRCTPVEVSRKWEYTRLEVASELASLKKIAGPCCTMGVTKARPCKGNSCQVVLNENDTVKVVRPIEVKDNFSRRNTTTRRIDLVSSEGFGGNVWARFTSEKAIEVPFLTTVLESMNVDAPNVVVDTTNDEAEVEIEHGISIF